jgi:ribosomal protein L7Ae-like RNA K-turn-binding protein
MDKIAGLLHLCNKAGKLVFGREAVFALSGRGAFALILTASDAGSDLKRKLSGLSPVNSGWSSERMGEIFGRSRLSVVGVKDGRIAAEIVRLLKTGRPGAE